jgi:hypothetical protein
MIVEEPVNEESEDYWALLDQVYLFLRSLLEGTLDSTLDSTLDNRLEVVDSIAG